MQTRCPHCETYFRVTEAQLNAAEGLVRCGVCSEVFNVFDTHEGQQVAQAELLETTDAHHDPILPRPDDVPGDGSDEPMAESPDEVPDDAMSALHDELSADTYSDSDTDPDRENQLTDDPELTPEAETIAGEAGSHLEHEISADTAEPYNEELSDTVPDELIVTSSEEENLYDSEPPDLHHHAAIAAGEADDNHHAPEYSVTTDGTRDSSAPAEGTDRHSDDFDFFDEKINVSQQRLVPDELRENSRISHRAMFSNLLWSFGILLFSGTLLLEYAWFNRHELSAIPELHQWMKLICQQTECTNFSVRAPSKIELITRNIYSHPTIKDALVVNVTMKNEADFAQPYPVMQIDFSDIRGGTVAARRFLPGEYLARDGDKDELIKPDASVDVTMEIQDPGEQAKTYEFNFL